jgi:hypothetical protein
VLSPTFTVYQDGTQVGPDPSGVALAGNKQVNSNPGLKSPYLVDVNVLASRAYPAFRQAIIIAQILPPRLMGDYHLTGTTSPAANIGAASTQVNWGTWVPAKPNNPAHWTGWSYTVNAPSKDIDGDTRPKASTGKLDAGSDELTP